MPDSGTEPQPSRAELYLEHRIDEKGLRPRIAASVIAVVWLIAIVLFGILQRAVDPTTFESIWSGMWWATQTVTTVGYGDIVPQSTAGQILGTLMMIGGLSFFAVLTGWITTAFVTRAQALRDQGSDQELRDKIDNLSAEITALQSRIDGLSHRPSGGP